MKVVQINATYKIGSTGKLSYDLSQAIKDKGYESMIAYAEGNSEYKNDYKIGNFFGHKIHAILSRISGLQGYYAHLSTFLLIRNLRKFNPDIIHLHNLHSNYINLKMLFNYLSKYEINTVITLHDCWFYTGKCTYYITANCIKWEKQCDKCPLIHKDNVNPTLFFDRTRKCYIDKKKWFSSIHNLHIVGVSNWIYNEARSSFFKNNNLTSIYNWVDEKIFYPRKNCELLKKYNLGNRYIVLMVSSTISTNKGYNEMVELSNRLDDNYKIIIIGKNKHNLLIPSNVIHISYTNSQSDLAEIYSCANVCVNTTKYETFGLVTAESLSCGTPVIVYDNTASPELIGDNCGYIIKEKYGTDGILESIFKLKSLDRIFVSNKCIKFAKNNFSKKLNTEKYLQAYSKLCIGRNRRI